MSTSTTKSPKKAARTHASHGTSTRFDLPGGAVGFVESSTAFRSSPSSLSLRSGALADPEGKDGLSRLTARMIRRGCKGMTSAEIESAVDRLGGELGFDVGPSTISLHGQVIRRNLEPSCDLIAQGPRHADVRPRRSSSASSARRVAELLEARDNDRALAGLAFRRALFGGHPYARTASGRPASVESSRATTSLATYAKHFVRRTS